MTEMVANRVDGLLTVAEAAARLRLSYPTTLALIKSGALPAARLGHTYRLRPAALDATLERLEHSEPRPAA